MGKTENKLPSDKMGEIMQKIIILLRDEGLNHSEARHMLEFCGIISERIKVDELRTTIGNIFDKHFPSMRQKLNEGK